MNKDNFRRGRNNRFQPKKPKDFRSKEEKDSQSRKKKDFRSGEQNRFAPGKRDGFKPGRQKDFRLAEGNDSQPGKKKDFRSGEQNRFAPKKRGNFKTGRRKDFRPKPNKFKSGDRFDFKKEKTSTPAVVVVKQEGTGLIRLNKYLSNAGICSRREADTFIEAGVVKVNGEIITQLGYKVSPGDKVQFGGNAVHKEKSVYILLNKPKGYITTCDDPQERSTVLDLVKGVQERIYPIGRLDRNTSGLLLLTNDGELAKILMHPKYKVPKIYHVVLDKILTVMDLENIQKGITLEDGLIHVDDIAYVEGAETKKEVGIEIHSGRNRIIRRLFEHLGYKVEKLDRVLYASLTKKNLPRGKWRHLDENEVRMLKRIR